MLSRISADTNVLFSGFYYRGAATPLVDAIENCALEFYQSEYLRDEILELCKRKSLPLHVLSKFYSLSNVHVVVERQYSESEVDAAMRLVRDKDDVPIFMFAKTMPAANAIDFFVTGDNDLLQPAVRKACRNKIITLQQFNKLLEKEARKR